MYKNGQCDCCGSENVPVKLGEFTVTNAGGFVSVNEELRCKICGDTRIQRVFNDEFSSHQEKVIPAIAIVGNLILKELTEIRKDLKHQSKSVPIIKKPGRPKK